MEDLRLPFHFYITYNCTNNTPNLTELISAFQRQQMHFIFHSNPNFSNDDICFCTSWDLQGPHVPHRAVTLLRPPSGCCPRAHVWLTRPAQLLDPTALGLTKKKKRKQQQQKRTQSRETSYANRKQCFWWWRHSTKVVLILGDSAIIACLEHVEKPETMKPS